MPHMDYLFIDLDVGGDTQMLTHIGTLESVALPQRGEWCLAYDSDGYAALLCDGASDLEYDPERFLTLQLFRIVDSARLFIMPRGSLDKNDAKFIDSALRSFEVRKVGMKLGPSRGVHSFDIIVCERPRVGFRVFFSAVSVYNSLAYDMFKGCASRWAWQQISAFEKCCSDLCPDQVQRSMPYQTASITEETRGNRVFPWHAWSSAALVGLMARLCAAPKRGGGLESDRCRQATALFLDALVEQVSAGRVLMIRLCVGYDSEWRWPRPADGEEHLDFLVEEFVGVEHVIRA